MNVDTILDRSRIEVNIRNRVYKYSCEYETFLDENWIIFPDEQNLFESYWIENRAYICIKYNGFEKVHCSKRNINIFKIEANFDWREKLVYQIRGWEEMNLKNLMKMTRKIIKVILCQLYRETSLFNILAVVGDEKKNVLNQTCMVSW